jgi:hypothetical protein
MAVGCKSELRRRLSQVADLQIQDRVQGRTGYESVRRLGRRRYRGAVPDASQKARVRKPENPEKRLENLRRRLENKNRKISELKKGLSGNGPIALGKDAARSPSDAEAGALPDFVIGGKKCGTTFLYHLLCRHPYVAPAAKKEVHYFDVRVRKGLGWYRSQFLPPEAKEDRRIISGEASPYYLYHPHAARRAAETVPQAKLITMPRDPIDRALSDYHDKVRQGKEPLSSFEEAIDAEENRLQGEREKMLADEHYKARNYPAYSYLARGIYVDQLQRWLVFFDREQMLVIKSEDMFGNVPDTLRRALAFLDLPGWEPEIPPVWEARNEGQYAPMNPATRQRLREYFAPHNQKLYEYLSTDFNW